MASAGYWQRAGLPVITAENERRKGKLVAACSPQACPLRAVSAFIAAGAP